MNNKPIYNPLIHHRRSIRIPEYDYSYPGAYFITICTYKHESLFGEIENGEMKLTEFGQIAHNRWRLLPERFINIQMDQFVVMPNHIHGILVITDPDLVGAGLAPAPEAIAQPHAGQPQGLPLRPTVGYVVGAYKSLVVNECLKICKIKQEIMGKIWQRNYYEHVIRDHKSFQNITNYIIHNPAQWEQDQLFC
jgi:putative transposase